MPPLSFSRLFGAQGRRAVESLVPRRTFDDVILPAATRRALDEALAQVTQHDLIFNRWGLGERHPTGLALAFNEADAIASKRSTSLDTGFQRESNTVVSVLLQELEWYNGVVIFATNLA